MRFSNKFLAAALVLVLTSLSSLVAQGYYAVLIKRDSEYVLQLSKFSTAPQRNKYFNGYKILKDPIDLATFDGTKDYAGKYKGLGELYYDEITRVEILDVAGFMPKSTAYWFCDLKNLKHIDGLHNLNTSAVTNMQDMFYRCSSLKGVDLGFWDTKNVTNMASMFDGCKSLQAVNFGESFVTNKVTNMRRMFCNCESLTHISLETFDMRNVKNIGSMFFYCSNLQLIFFCNSDYIKLPSDVFGIDCFAGCEKLQGYSSISETITNRHYYYGVLEVFKSADIEGGYLSKTARGGEYKHSITDMYLQIPNNPLVIPYGGELDLSEAYLVQNYKYGYQGKQTIAYKLVSLEASVCEIKTPNSFNNKNLGLYRFDVNYYGHSSNSVLTYYISVLVQDAFKEYKVIAAPTKKDYALPITEADLDLSGMKVQKVMHSGAVSSVDVTKFKPSVTGLNHAKLGDQEISLVFTIGGETLTYKYTINVKDAVKEFKVIAEPTKKEYTMPFTEKDLDLSGFVVKKEMWGGTTEDFIMSNLKCNVRGLDPKKAGEQEITLLFTLADGTNYEYKYVINVIDVLKDVLVESIPSLKEYKLPVALEDLNLSGGIIKKVYESDSTVEYAMETMDFSVEGLDEVKAGENTLVLNFDLGDTIFEWKYKINVLEEGEEPIVAVEDLNEAAVGGAAFEAWTSGGVLNVKAVRGGVLEVLSVNGALLRRVSVAAGALLNLPLERGVYVLRLGGEVRKVVVE